MKNLYSAIAAAVLTMTALPAVALTPVAGPSGNADSVVAAMLPGMKVQAINNEPVTNPFGEKFKVVQDGNAYYMSAGICFNTNVGGFATHMVEGYDGKMYLYNPISMYDSRSYAQLERRGEDLVMKLPQLLFNFQNSVTPIPYYIDRIVVTTDDKGLVFTPDPEVREIVYKYEDGKYIMQNDDKEGRVIGLAMVEGNVSDPTVYRPNGFVEMNTVYSVFTDKLLKTPAGMESESWSLTYREGGQNENNGHFIRVGFDGDDMYVLGLIDRCPDGWIKGKVKDNKVTFPSGQYIGETNYGGSQNYYVFFMGAKLEYMEGQNEGWVWVLKDEITFDYNDETKELTSSFYDAVLGNNGRSVLYYDVNDLYQFPRIFRHVPTSNFTPGNPQILNHIAYNPTNGFEGLKFWVPKTNEDGELLEEANLSFVCFVDDFEDPFVFYPDEYRNLRKEMTLIPLNFTDNYDFGLNGLEHTVYFYMEDISNVGVMSVYDDGEKYHYSQIISVNANPMDFEGEIEYVTSGGNDAVKGINGGNVVSETYFDLAGRRVANPVKGIYVKVSVLEDGRTISSKVAIK